MSMWFCVHTTEVSEVQGLFGYKRFSMSIKNSKSNIFLCVLQKNKAITVWKDMRVSQRVNYPFKAKAV